MKPSMAIQVRQLSSAKCRVAASITHAAPGTGGVASTGLSRKPMLRSSTEACRFTWMCVTESLCFLRVGAWPSATWMSPGSAAPWAHRHRMTGTQVKRGGSCTTAATHNAAGLLPPLLPQPAFCLPGKPT